MIGGSSGSAGGGRRSSAGPSGGGAGPGNVGGGGGEHVPVTPATPKTNTNPTGNLRLMNSPQTHDGDHNPEKPEKLVLQLKSFWVFDVKMFTDMII